MADSFTPDVRSRVMSRIRSRDTRPELYVRRAVWAEGFRYRLHVRAMPGVPDLVLPKYRIVIFVHGCFWHQHGCRKTRRPASNREYWDWKLDGNVARDALNRSRLEGMGWAVATVWECRLAEGTGCGDAGVDVGWYIGPAPLQRFAGISSGPCWASGAPSRCGPRSPGPVSRRRRRVSVSRRALVPPGGGAAL